MYETGGHVTAERHLEELLAAGRAAIAWVDLAHLPQHGLPGELDGCLGQVVGVVGLDDAHAYLDERGEHALPVSREALAAARGRIGSFKHRLLAVSGSCHRRLAGRDLAGLRDHVVHLGRASDSFSLPAIRKWARLIVDERHAKGWRRVFADRRSLYSALLGAYEGTQPSVSGGGALRGLYADFIDEAATLLAMPALATAAPPYRAAEEAWRRFAQACLPGFVAPFGQARRLLARREALLLHGAHTPASWPSWARSTPHSPPCAPSWTRPGPWITPAPMRCSTSWRRAWRTSMPARWPRWPRCRAVRPAGLGEGLG